MKRAFYRRKSFRRLCGWFVGKTSPGCYSYSSFFGKCSVSGWVYTDAATSLLSSVWSSHWFHNEEAVMLPLAGQASVNIRGSVLFVCLKSADIKERQTPLDINIHTIQINRREGVLSEQPAEWNRAAAPFRGSLMGSLCWQQGKHIFLIETLLSLQDVLPRHTSIFQIKAEGYFLYDIWIHHDIMMNTNNVN